MFALVLRSWSTLVVWPLSKAGRWHGSYWCAEVSAASMCCELSFCRRTGNLRGAR